MRITNTSKGTRVFYDKRNRAVTVAPGATVDADLNPRVSQRIIGSNRSLQTEAAAKKTMKKVAVETTTVDLNDAEARTTAINALIEEVSGESRLSADSLARAEELLGNKFPTKKKPTKKELLDLLWAETPEGKPPA